jgi:hypothetical protein
MDKIKRKIFFHCRQDKQILLHHDIFFKALFELLADRQEPQN